MAELKHTEDDLDDDGFPSHFDATKDQIKAAAAAHNQSGDTKYEIDTNALATWDRRMKPSVMIQCSGQLLMWFGGYDDEAQKSKAFAGGTATIIKKLSNNYYMALTCGHNVVRYDQIDKNRSKAKNIYYFPKGTAHSKCRMQCKESAVFNDYDASSAMCPNDLAVVLLYDKKGELGEASAHFNDFNPNDDIRLKEWDDDDEASLGLWGYPTKSGGKLQGQDQRDAMPADGLWKYDRTLYTYPGHSGAALYEKVRKKYDIYGVHTYGEPNKQKNCGVRLNDKKIKWIESFYDKFEQIAKNAEPIKPKEQSKVSKDDVKKSYGASFTALTAEMEENLDELEDTESVLKDLQNKYSQSVERIKAMKVEQSEETKKKVIVSFEEIGITLKAKENKTLNEIDNITKGAKSAEHDDDEKETDILVKSISILENERNAINESLTLCTNMMTQRNVDKKKRRKQLVDIGRDTAVKFIQVQEKLETNIVNVRKLIEDNANTVIQMDYAVNTKRMNKLKRAIDGIGAVIYDENVGSKQEAKVHEFADDEDEIAMKVLRREIEDYKQKNAALRRDFKAKAQQYTELESEQKRKDEDHKQQLETKIQQLTVKQNQMDTMTKELNTSKAQNQHHAQQITTLKQELNTKTENCKALETEKKQKNETIKSVKNELNDEQQRVQSLNKAIKDHKQGIEAQRQQLTTKQNEMDKMKTEHIVSSLRSALTFDAKSLCRWYQSDEKEDAAVAVKIKNDQNITDICGVDDIIKSYISKKDTSLAPNGNTVNDLCRIIGTLTANTKHILNKMSFNLPYVNSVFLQRDELNQLFCDMLPSSLRNKSFRLLVRGSEHGFDPKTFHSRCDNKGATLVIVASEEYERIFGGYVSISWQSSGGMMEDTNAFVYFISEEQNKGKRFGIKANGEEAIYCGSDYGVMFGGGRDLGWDNDDEATYGECRRYSYDYSSAEDETPLAGDEEFSVAEYEVWSVR